ncbi:RNA 2',3'-cyclic phosphodiesterase [Desulfatiferula olefinivorans]
MSTDRQASDLLRLFIAVVPDPTVLAAMHRIIAEGRARLRACPLRWVTPETTHLTLRFLGDTPAGRCPDLIAALDGICKPIRPFDLTLASLLCLPRPARTRVLAVGIAPSPPLDQLALGIETAVRRLGFAPEPRPFLGHITLARCNTIDLRHQAPPIRFDGLIVPVRAVELIRSTLTPRGARYTHLARLPLVADPP